MELWFLYLLRIQMSMIRRFEKVFAITRKPKSILKCEYEVFVPLYFFFGPINRQYKSIIPYQDNLI